MIPRRRLGAASLVLMLAACASPPPPSEDPAGPSRAALPSLGGSGIIGDPGNPLALGPPDRPFDVAAILAAMRESRRPGGVPQDVQTEEVAAAVAAAIWTLEGDPWETISAAGSCESGTCTLELAGATEGAAGEDVWVLSIVPDSAQVEVVTADLHAVPSATVDALDQLARGAEGGEALSEMLLASVRWQPPPEDGHFVMAYRSGDEEESCSIDVELDVASETVTEVAASGC